MARESNRAALPLTVVALGLVSLLTDASSEMIFPLLPAFLAARVPDAAVVLGAMEGVADFVSSIFKYLSGRWADRAVRMKPFVAVGYSLSTVMRPLMALVTRPWQPLIIRASDRVGKGLRSTPRDALIAAWVPEGARARAFSFHRGMDHVGAAIGSALAIGLISYGFRAEQIFLASVVPGALAVLTILLVREAPTKVSVAKKGLQPVPRRIWAYLVPVTLFGMGNATDAFLLLKLREQGAAASTLPLAWLVLHVVKAAASYPAGWLADRLGSARIVFAGWVLYALSYGALAESRTIAFTFATIAFYGLYHALSEGAEKALLTSLTPSESRGRALGLYNSLAGVSSLAAGLLFGFIWSRAGSAVAFWVSCGLALGSAGLLPILLPRARGVGAA